MGSAAKATGTYIVLADGELSDMKEQDVSIQFKGYKNGTVVVDEPFTFYDDCCHVNKRSGKDAVELP